MIKYLILDKANIANDFTGITIEFCNKCLLLWDIETTPEIMIRDMKNGNMQMFKQIEQPIMHFFNVCRNLPNYDYDSIEQIRIRSYVESVQFSNLEFGMYVIQHDVTHRQLINWIVYMLAACMRKYATVEIYSLITESGSYDLKKLVLRDKITKLALAAYNSDYDVERLAGMERLFHYKKLDTATCFLLSNLNNRFTGYQGKFIKMNDTIYIVNLLGKTDGSGTHITALSKGAPIIDEHDVILLSEDELLRYLGYKE